MKFKLFCAVAAVGFAGAAQAAYADTPAPTPEFTVTGSAELASQYRFRGISQSNNQPAVQASMTITDKSGFYVSTWGSSTYGDPNGYADAGSHGSPVNPGGTEIDAFAGYSHVLGTSGITADGGLYGYIYPGNAVTSYYEIYGDLSKSYGPVGVKVGINWAPQQKGLDTSVTGSLTHTSAYKYFELTYSPAKMPALTLHSHIAQTAGGFDYMGAKEYLDYTVGAGYKWKNLTLDLSAVGTNITRSNIANITGPALASVNTYYYRPAKSVAVLSLTASF